MSRERVQGLAEANAMLDAIPSAAEQELIVDLALIGRDILGVQRRIVPVATGNLRGALSLAVLLDGLRLRVGLLGVAARSRSAIRRAAARGDADPRSYLDEFYGRIVEFGRSAQTVLVQRRRRINGQLRVSRGRKRAEDIAATYTLHVKARAPHPFVNINTNADLDAIATARLESFWSKVFQRAGAPS